MRSGPTPAASVVAPGSGQSSRRIAGLPFDPHSNKRIMWEDRLKVRESGSKSQLPCVEVVDRMAIPLEHLTAYGAFWAMLLPVGLGVSCRTIRARYRP